MGVSLKSEGYEYWGKLKIDDRVDVDPTFGERSSDPPVSNTHKI